MPLLERVLYAVRRYAAGFVCVWMVAGFPAPIYAQPATSPSPAPGVEAGLDAQPVILKFLDSSTGQAVKPTDIQLNNSPARFSVEAGSLVYLQLPEGKHDIQIQAQDYQPLESAITVSPEPNPVMTFELDPASATEAAPIPPGTAVIEGHITDADTGGLLEQVQVSLPDASLTTTTDASGSYQFQLKVPEVNDAARPAITLEARADGYTTLRMKNLALTPGQRRRMPLAMEKSTTESLTSEVQVTDEASAAGSHRSFEWVFDATLR